MGKVASLLWGSLLIAHFFGQRLLNCANRADRAHFHAVRARVHFTLRQLAFHRHTHMDTPLEDKTMASGDVTKYGGLKGENSKYIKLISSDQHEFIVETEMLLGSNTIKSILMCPSVADEEKVRSINLNDIPSRILEKIICYLQYKRKYITATENIPDFELDPTWVMELLLAAHFLDC